MDQKTILIILCVVVLWAVLFGVFMVFGKKRNQKAKGFYADHQDKAILHLYGTKIKMGKISLNFLIPQEKIYKKWWR